MYFTYSIYTLNNPLTNDVWYVGVTKHTLYQRLIGHLNDSKLYSWKKTDKDYWILSLMNKGLKPTINLVENCDYMEWEFSERFWINYFRQLNPCLLNKSTGGKHGNYKK